MIHSPACQKLLPNIVQNKKKYHTVSISKPRKTRKKAGKVVQKPTGGKICPFCLAFFDPRLSHLPRKKKKKKKNRPRPSKGSFLEDLKTTSLNTPTGGCSPVGWPDPNLPNPRRSQTNSSGLKRKRKRGKW